MKGLGASACLPGIVGATSCVHAQIPPREGKRIMSDDSKVLRSRMIEVDNFPYHMLESTLPVPEETPTVVLVHGLALSGQYMVPTAEELAPFCKVYIPDFPGFGDSGKPSCVLDVPGLADALAVWMDAVELDSAILMGNSFGCQIIAEFAVRHPEKLQRAVLQGPTTDPYERSWLMQFIRWQQNAPHNPPMMSKIADIDYAKCGVVRALTTFQFSLNHKIEDKLPLIKAPALVIRGSEDPICRQDWAEEVKRLLPKGELTIIPSVAHTLVFTSPKLLVGASRSFIGI